MSAHTQPIIGQKAETTEEATGGLPAPYVPAHASLAVSLARAEVDQQIMTARAMPRSIQRAVSNITTLATLDEETASECIYALPRGGKTIRGPSIRFAEIMASQWGNCRVGARVVHVDWIEAYVEAEGVFHDLETNVAQTARVRRPIQAKRGKGIDNDMIQLAGAAACSIARRNAILAGIPKGVARKGYLAVEDVIRGDAKTLAERRALALRAFGAMGVTSDRVFAAIGVKGEDDITLDHLTTLTGVRSAIKNDELTIDEAFPAVKPEGQPARNLSEALDKLAGMPVHDPATGEVKSEATDQPAANQNSGGEQPESTAAGEDQPADAKGAEASATSTKASAPAAAKSEPKSAKKSAKAETKAPSADERNALILADLKKTGDAAAAKGRAALDDFIDNLSGDEKALVPFAAVKAWRAAADQAGRPEQ